MRGVPGPVNVFATVLFSPGSASIQKIPLMVTLNVAIRDCHVGEVGDWRPGMIAFLSARSGNLT